MAFLLVALLFCAGALALAHVLTMKVVHRLIDQISRISTGDFQTRVERKGPPQLKALIGALNVQAEDLARHFDNGRQAAVQETQELFQSLVNAIEKLAREKADEVERQNVTLHEKNRELERASRLKSEFLANMSHELRTPLTSVIGYSEILKEDIAGEINDEQREYVGDIHRAGKHLLAMINDILDLAKIEAGKMEFQRERVDLSLTAVEAEYIARSLSMRKGITLEVKAPEGLFGMCDAQRLKQVALNLLSNAMKFTPAGGKVTFTVREAPPFAELVVTDTGIGIDASHHELIFDAFQQVDGSSAREYQGTGLGLSLVRRFAEGMGGGVSVQSERGRGSTFTVRVPLWVDASSSQRQVA